MSDTAVNIINNTKDQFLMIYGKAEGEIKQISERMGVSESDPIDSMKNTTRLANQINEVMDNANRDAFNAINNLINSMKSNPEVANSPALNSFLTGLAKFQVQCAQIDSFDDKTKKVSRKDSDRFKQYVWNMYQDQINAKLEALGLNNDAPYNYPNPDYKLVDEFFEAAIASIEKAGVFDKAIYDIVRNMDKYQGVSESRDKLILDSAKANNDYIFGKKGISPENADKIKNPDLKKIYLSIVKDYKLLEELAKEGGLDNSRTEVTREIKERLSRACEAFAGLSEKLKLDKDIVDPVKELAERVKDVVRVEDNQDVMIRNGSEIDIIYSKTMDESLGLEDSPEDNNESVENLDDEIDSYLDGLAKLNNEQYIENNNIANNDEAEKERNSVLQELDAKSSLIQESIKKVNYTQDVSEMADIQNKLLMRTKKLFENRGLLKEQAKAAFDKIAIASDDAYRLVYEKTQNGFGASIVAENDLIEALGGRKAILKEAKVKDNKNISLSEIIKSIPEENEGPKIKAYKCGMLFINAKEQIKNCKEKLDNKSKPLDFDTKKMVLEGLAGYSSAVKQYNTLVNAKDIKSDEKAKIVLDGISKLVAESKDFTNFAFASIAMSTNYVDEKEAQLNEIFKSFDKTKTNYTKLKEEAEKESLKDKAKKFHRSKTYSQKSKNFEGKEKDSDKNKKDLDSKEKDLGKKDKSLGGKGIK